MCGVPYGSESRRDCRADDSGSAVAWPRFDKLRLLRPAGNGVMLAHALSSILCANHQVAHRKAPAWMGHSSSEILDLYYHLSDPDSQGAMKALATATTFEPSAPTVTLTGQDAAALSTAPEGNLRVMGQSTNEKPPQVILEKQLVAVLDQLTERGGFEPP